MTPLSLAKPTIIAHRGYSARYPENTHAAFAAAIDSGAHMIEMDATLTRDGEAVIVHDERVDRTTDGHGRVCDFSLEEIRRLDAGGWFGRRFTGEQVPTLEEVVRRYGGKIFLNIEMKRAAVANRLVEVVVEGEARQRVLVSSFSRRALTAVKRLAPDIPLALLSRSAADRKALSFCLQLGTYSWHPSLRDMSRDSISPFTAAGLRVYPYTVNTREEMARVFGMGASGIITDDPASAAESIRRSGG